jgi:hypothetical protein
MERGMRTLCILLHMKPATLRTYAVHFGLQLGAVLWLSACSALPAVQVSPPANGTPPTPVIPGRTFDNGHRIEGAFLTAFDSSGGLAWLGQPISRPILDQDLGWVLQVFEFGVLAQDPSDKRVFPLRANVILGRQTAPAARSPDEGCTFFAETGHNVCHGMRLFWETSDRARLGLPISEEWVETDGGLTQDFEFARLHALGGQVARQPIGPSFFAAREYAAEWLDPPEAFTPTSPPRVTASPVPLPTLPATSPATASTPTVSPTAQPGATPSALIFSNGLTVGGEFLIAYRAAGGEVWLGTPLSAAFVDSDLGLTLQVFEFGALAMEPEGDHAFLASVTTLMGRQQPPVPAARDPGCDYFEETGHNVCFQFRTTYRELGRLRLGFPLTEVETDARGVLGQDFEYARLEWLNGKVHRAPIGRDFLRTRSTQAFPGS